MGIVPEQIQPPPGAPLIAHDQPSSSSGQCLLQQQQSACVPPSANARVIKSKSPNQKSQFYTPAPQSLAAAAASGGTANCNSFALSIVDARALRPIVIDGCNVAYGHSGNFRQFSARGIWLCAKHWRDQGHKVHVVIPKGGREVLGGEVSDYHLLESLEAMGEITYSPTRQVPKPNRNGNGLEFYTVKPYDDRLIVQIAHISGGVIISNDNYRDIAVEHPQWLETIEKRIIMYTWLEDVIIFPLDPIGRSGPNLADIIRFPLGMLPPSLRADDITVVPPQPMKRKKCSMQKMQSKKRANVQCRDDGRVDQLLESAAELTVTVPGGSVEETEGLDESDGHAEGEGNGTLQISDSDDDIQILP